jgi:hypothetical protein
MVTTRRARGLMIRFDSFLVYRGLWVGSTEAGRISVPQNVTAGL